MATFNLKNSSDDFFLNQVTVDPTESDKTKFAEVESNTTESDEGLMKRMVLREEEALIELHRRYAPRLTAALWKLLPEENPETKEAHTLVEDAFVQAWQNVHHFNTSRVSARGWLVVLTLRLVLGRSQTRGWPYRTLEDVKQCLEGRVEKRQRRKQ
jgi:DNA-directed RNA polymerase specialized sigma24 family protein